MNKYLVFSVYVLIPILSMILMYILIEYIRRNYTLQEFKNVDTKRASFSITTIPSRIEHIEPCIKSLLFQNPKTVYLNIPHKFKKEEEALIEKALAFARNAHGDQKRKR